jgi:hypothetical protein
MSIDKAASAFDAAINGSTSGGNDGSVDADFSDIFQNMGALENADEPAGGDDSPLPGTSKQVAVRDNTRTPAELDDDDPEAFMYSDGDAQRAIEGTDDGSQDQGDDEEGGDELEEGDIDPNIAVVVKVDGVDKTVTIREAIDGYIRTDTFHTRMNKVEEAKVLIQQEAGKLLEDRKRALAMIDELGESLSELLPAEPNWDEQYRVDPVKARALQKDYETFVGRLQNLAKRRQDLVAQMQAADAEGMKAYAAAEELKVLSNPFMKHWADPKMKEKDLKSMVQTLKVAKFTDQEIAGVFDSRMLEVALKASKYDRMTANRPKPSQRGKTPVNPGAGSRGTAPRGIVRATQRLQRSGSVQDAGEVFTHLIQKG